MFFVNAMLNAPVLATTSLKMYADDIVLYATSRYPAVALRDLQSDAERINKKIDSLGLTINHDKTKLVWFCAAHNRKFCANRVLKIGNKKITEVNAFSYLHAEHGRLHKNCPQHPLHLLQVWYRLRHLMSEDKSDAALAALEDHSVEFTYPDWAAALANAGVIAGMDVDKAAEVMQAAGHEEAEKGGADYDEALRNAGIL